MRDGVTLSTNIRRPDAPGQFPTVLWRTPYGKVEGESAAGLVPHGYVLVAQDVRGRFQSEGEWNPFFHEAADGDDAINWIASQPWSDGRVVMAGGSYGAMVEWLAATRHNPHLKGLISMVSPSDIYDGTIYQGGALNLGALEMWAATMDGKQPDLAHLPKTRPEWEKIFAGLPLTDALREAHHAPAFFREWIAHPASDAFWQPLRWKDSYATIDLPVLHQTGWYDMFQRGTLENFAQMRQHAPVAVRGDQYLIVGPWAHQGAGRKLGDVDFGADAAADLPRLFLKWLDRHLKEQGTENLPPVHVFTMGENTWRDYAAWPVPGTEFTKFYLHSVGTLSQAQPASEKPDRYTYDPANPVPTRGGGTCCFPNMLPWGPMDQREVEARPDVLVYSSAPLAADLRVTGPINARLWISSSAPDTDFTVKLVDVSPEGFAMNLTDGILRVRYRSSFQSPELMKPGKLYTVAVDVGNTSNLFRKGHQIRVEVSSSNFPHFSRNTNTGRQPETDADFRKARQTVGHDARHDSYIVLPVVPGAQTRAGGS
jgi:putative CocE/NonD family hydrolase